VDLKTVKDLAGHSSLDITLKYAHLAPEVSQDAIAKLNKRFDLVVDSHAAAG
jgi:site-specific recombinase XerD